MKRKRHAGKWIFNINNRRFDKRLEPIKMNIISDMNWKCFNFQPQTLLHWDDDVREFRIASSRCRASSHVCMMEVCMAKKRTWTEKYFFFRFMCKMNGSVKTFYFLFSQFKTQKKTHHHGTNNFSRLSNSLALFLPIFFFLCMWKHSHSNPKFFFLFDMFSLLC